MMERLLPFIILLLVAAGAAPAAGTDGAGQVTLLLAGDIQPGVDGSGAHWFEKKLRGLGSDYPFANIAPFLNGYDLVVGNLEGTLTRSKTRYKKEFNFKNSPRFARALKKAGFSCMVLANNHSWDYGYRGLAETRAALRRNGIGELGAGINGNTAYRPVIIEKNGIRVGLLAFTDVVIDEQAPVATTRGRRMERAIRRAKKNVDFLIVSMHWGVERSTAACDRQRVVARRAARAGADFIFGHHPHCMQPMETIGSVPVFYSLGEFVFYRKSREQQMLSLCLRREKGRVSLAFRRIPLVIIDGQTNFLLKSFPFMRLSSRQSKPNAS